MPDKIMDTDDAWDSRALGADEAFAVAAEMDETALDEALELQPISIRLHKSLIEDFKLIAGMNGLGYQTLMRQVLRRFADCEKKQILRDMAAEYAKEQSEEAPKEDLRKAA
ncbi:MAG: hypothetical protein Q8O33_01345 [Pseudomonadota bacterium]|nr:hypothetical protein [Pseudomonadota bacterium]